METIPLIDLIEYLCRPAQRVRTGIWLEPNEAVGNEKEVIASLGRLCDAVDMQEVVLKRRPETTKYSGISVDRIHEWVDDTLSKDVETDCAILYHLDLILSYLPSSERERTFEIFNTAFTHRPTAIIVALPAGLVGGLLREEWLEDWRASNRLVE